jgi:hypothetical protein
MASQKVAFLFHLRPTSSQQAVSAAAQVTSSAASGVSASPHRPVLFVVAELMRMCMATCSGEY